jgi:hypothetical protein
MHTNSGSLSVYFISLSEHDSIAANEQTVNRVFPYRKSWTKFWRFAATNDMTHNNKRITSFGI